MYRMNQSIFAGVLFFTIALWGLNPAALQANAPSTIGNTTQTEIADRDGHRGGRHHGGGGKHYSGRHHGHGSHNHWGGHYRGNWSRGYTPYYNNYYYTTYPGYYNSGYYNSYYYDPYYRSNDGVDIYFGF